ncbi:MAG TPA: hypothetical protein VLD38_04310 [Nitrosopumilaceae archaeon]|nr:hypothetical protein [Nitrosopumilaceae archaeon]
MISISNQSESLATIRLFETGQNNGIFEGSFILTPDMSKFLGDVTVSKGDHILLSFQPDKDNQIVKEVFVRFPPESKFPDIIKIPFSQSELVVVGNIVSKEKIPSRNQTMYSIKVEEYLKNPKPYDMITVLGDGINEDVPFTDEVTYYNRPIFDVGNKVFVYLKKENNTFKISPQSFTLAKNHMGPPTDVWPTGPSKFEFEYNEPITISGLVKKAYLYDAEKRGENTTAYVKIYNPNNELYAAELLETNPDGAFTYSVKIRGKLGIDGLYNYDTGLPHQNYQGGFFIKPFQLSPLKQFKSGLEVDQIKCRENLLLIGKIKNASPVCVKPDTAVRLIKSGWARSIIPTLFGTAETECGTSFWIINSGRTALNQSEFIGALKDLFSSIDYFSDKFGDNWQDKIRISKTLWSDVFYVDFPIFIEAGSFDSDRVQEYLQTIHSTRTSYFGTWCNP